MVCVYLYPSGRTLMHICYIGCVGDSMRQSRYSYTAVNRQWLISRLNTNTQRTKKVYKIWNQDEPKQKEAVSSFCDVEITDRYVLICTRRFSEINIRIERHIVKDFSDNKCMCISDAVKLHAHMFIYSTCRSNSTRRTCIPWPWARDKDNPE